MTVRQKLAVAAVGLVAASAAIAITYRYGRWPARPAGGDRGALVTLAPITMVLPESGKASPTTTPKGARAAKRHALSNGEALSDSVRIQIGAILRIPTLGVAPEPVPPPEAPRVFARGSDSAQPVRRTAFGTPFVEPPRIANRGEATRLLRRIYPPELRAAPVAGTTVLRMRITEDGEVEHRYVAASSGNLLLDQAALAAMRSLRFTPARFAGQRVGSEVEIPVVFRVQTGS